VYWIQLAQDRGQWRAVVNNLSGFIKGWEFLDQLSDCQSLEKDSAPWSYSLPEVTPSADRKLTDAL